MFCVSFFAPFFTHFNMIFLAFHIFRYFWFPRLRCEYPLWCGDWLHQRWLHSNGNRRKYEVEIHKKLRKSKWKSEVFTSSPKWKLFSLQNVLISFERKHWRKANGSGHFKSAHTKTRLRPLLDGFLLRHTAIWINTKS